MKIAAMLLILLVTAVAQELPKHHHVFLFTAVAGAMALDAYSTQRSLSPRIEAKYDNQIIELNPLARPFVNNGWKGQLLVSGFSFSATVAGSRVLHHFGHHRLEVILPVFVGAASAYYGARNLRRWR